MNYLSVCSGIEAATIAWAPLGWKAVAYSEIEPFPSAVLAHHHPEVPNLGDMTNYENWKIEQPINVLCGGTPCQSFSIAGLRAGMEDPRGNLALVFVEIAAKFRPDWVVWENVAGVLSSGGGADFAAILGAFTGRAISAPSDGWKNSGVMQGIKGAYSVAWRMYDAQYFGVAQRRRRIFIVGHIADWRGAASVLFEPHCLQGHSAPSREARKDSSASVATRTGNEGGNASSINEGGTEEEARQAACDSEDENAVVGTIAAHSFTGGMGGRPDGAAAGHVVIDRAAFNQGENALYEPHIEESEVMDTIVARGPHAVGVPSVANCLQTTCDDYSRANGFNAIVVHGTQDPCVKEECTHTLGRNSGQENAVAIPIQNATRGKSFNGKGFREDGAPMYTLDTASQHAVCFAENSRGEVRLEGEDGQRTGALSTGGGKPGQGTPVVAFERRMVRTTGGQPQEELNHCLRADPNTGDGAPYVATEMAVRRLTPIECERLQGFPDNFTQIPRGKKEAEDCPDGPRYKAIGNSWAVPCARSIGESIQAWENLQKPIKSK